MYAVIETSGKQYQVEEGRYIDVDLLNAEAETNISLDKVVAIVAGEHSQIGQPYVEGACVHGKILKHVKGRKTVTFKMKQKKGYRVKQGHRQRYTRILIENIEFPNKEETMNYVKELEEKLEQERAEKEAKIREAREKRLAKKKAKKAKSEETITEVQTPAADTEQAVEEHKAEEESNEQHSETPEATVENQETNPENQEHKEEHNN